MANHIPRTTGRPQSDGCDKEKELLPAFSLFGPFLIQGNARQRNVFILRKVERTSDSRAFTFSMGRWWLESGREVRQRSSEILARSFHFRHTQRDQLLLRQTDQNGLKSIDSWRSFQSRIPDLVQRYLSQSWLKLKVAGGHQSVNFRMFLGLKCIDSLWFCLAFQQICHYGIRSGAVFTPRSF
jgi:hypothetical protein